MFKKLLNLLSGLYEVQAPEPFEENGRMYIMVREVKSDLEFYTEWMSGISTPIGGMNSISQVISPYKWVKRDIGPAEKEVIVEW